MINLRLLSLGFEWGNIDEVQLPSLITNEPGKDISQCTHYLGVLQLVGGETHKEDRAQEIECFLCEFDPHTNEFARQALLYYLRVVSNVKASYSIVSSVIASCRESCRGEA